jgi:hypothetical protein
VDTPADAVRMEEKLAQMGATTLTGG